MIKNVVFDIGGVLASFDYRKFLSSKGCEGELKERIVNASVKGPWWEEYDRGLMSDEEIMDKFCESDPEIEGEIRRVFSDIHGLIEKREESLPWIRALKKKGYKVLVLSNYSQRALDGCPEATDFLDEVDGGILSFRDRVIKPEPRIYQLMNERYDLVPDETVFIDDMPVNVEGARNAGWHGIQWVERSQVEEALHDLGVFW